MWNILQMHFLLHLFIDEAIMFLISPFEHYNKYFKHNSKLMQSESIKR